MIPQVDIILPNYNYTHFLDTCLTSITQQPGVTIRVLVLDDGSLGKYAFNRTIPIGANVTLEIRYYRFNRGHIYTYNEGIRWVEAPYYMLLSPDDQLLPGGLSMLLRALQNHPEASFAFSPARTGCDLASAAGTIGALGMEFFIKERPALIDGSEFRRHISSLWFNPVPTPTALVRTSAQRQAGGYRYNHPSAGDLELWLRLSRYGPVVYVPWPTAFYRQHSSNMQGSYVRARYREPVHLARVYLESGIQTGVETIAHTLVQVALLLRLARRRKRPDTGIIPTTCSSLLSACPKNEQEWRRRLLSLALYRYPALRLEPGQMRYSHRELLSRAHWPGWKIFLIKSLTKLISRLSSYWNVSQCIGFLSQGTQPCQDR